MIKVGIIGATGYAGGELVRIDVYKRQKLYQVEREKSYYVPAAKATREEIEHVKNILTQPSMQ